MASSHWFIILDGRDHGPLTCEDLRALAETGSIDGETPVSHPDIIGPLPARRIAGVIGSRAETVVSEPVPDGERNAGPSSGGSTGTSPVDHPRDESGAAIYYVRIGGENVGPLTSTQLKAMADAQQIDPDTRVSRQGAPGTASARRMPGLFPAEVLARHAAKAALESGTPERHVTLGPEAKAEFYRVDGEHSDGPFTGDEIKTMAATGVITPTTRLRRGGSVMTFSARRIVGLFPPEVIAAFEKPGAGSAAKPAIQVDIPPRPAEAALTTTVVDDALPKPAAADPAPIVAAADQPAIPAPPSPPVAAEPVASLPSTPANQQDETLTERLTRQAEPAATSDHSDTRQSWTAEVVPADPAKPARSGMWASLTALFRRKPRATASDPDDDSDPDITPAPKPISKKKKKKAAASASATVAEVRRPAVHRPTVKSKPMPPDPTDQHPTEEPSNAADGQSRAVEKKSAGTNAPRNVKKAAKRPDPV